MSNKISWDNGQTWLDVETQLECKPLELSVSDEEWNKWMAYLRQNIWPTLEIPFSFLGITAQEAVNYQQELSRWLEQLNDTQTKEQK